MTLHSRQFISCPRPLTVAANWENVHVGERTLSVAPDLRKRRIRDGSGGEWWLLGTALSASGDPADDLSRTPTDSVPTATREWLGRWALVGAMTVVGDAAGLLPIFWRQTCDGLWCASSVQLLISVPGGPRLSRIGTALRHGITAGMPWYPMPATGFAEVSGLLPSQILSLRSGMPDRKELVAPRDDIKADLAVDRLAESLRASVLRAAEIGPLWVACSGGLDSRLILASVAASGAPATLFTFLRRGMSRGDRSIPPRLARHVGLPHVAVSARRRSSPWRQCWDVHTAGQTAGVDRRYTERGQWQRIPQEAVILRGGLFELSRAHYTRPGKLREIDASDPGAMGAEIERYFQLQRFLPESVPHREGIRRWSEWAVAHPEALDWRDRFYWEQDGGSWLSAIEQGLDVVAPTRLHLANCARTLETIVRLPTEVRRGGGFERAVIEKLAPSLLEEPINPPDGRLAKLAVRLRWRAARLTYPVPR